MLVGVSHRVKPDLELEDSLLEIRKDEQLLIQTQVYSKVHC